MNFYVVSIACRKFSEDIPDIEDIWTSSFIDQIPQLDGAGDKDPPPSMCRLLSYSLYLLLYSASLYSLYIITVSLCSSLQVCMLCKYVYTLLGTSTFSRLCN